MRYLPLALIALVTAAIAALPGQPGLVRFTPLPLDRDRPTLHRLGALEHEGSWRLESDMAGFGGISALHVARGEVLALTDSATLLRFRFDGRATEAPIEARPLPGIFSPENGKPDSDSESLVLDPATGTAWAGFETSNVIRRFGPGLAEKTGWAIPAGMKDWPHNSGPEAMIRLADGRFLIFSEGAQGPKGSYEALLVAGDPTDAALPALPFFYRPPNGFQPTDAVELPDGRLLMLNRYFSLRKGVAASLVILDPRRIAPGAIIAGREIARLAPPLLVDNMEGLSIEPTAKRGRITVWLVSDDNFNPLQQTVLMRFALDLERVR